MANSTSRYRDSDPCHVLWQVNQIAAQVLRLTRMVQPAERTKQIFDSNRRDANQRHRPAPERRSDSPAGRAGKGSLNECPILLRSRYKLCVTGNET